MSAQAQLVWSAALAAYVVAVLHRSSFGVAGVQAAERFDVNATVLSTFVVVQLGVYAAMQVPAGVLLDRFGARAMITGGAVLMATGQLLLGVVDGLPLAYLARVLIGTGDAATFISVLRLVATWFPARRVPLFTQLTGLVGQLGQLAAAIPLVAVLHLAGWSPAFIGMAATGALAALLAGLAVRDRPAGHRVEHVGGGMVEPLRAVMAEPGTWLGFWSHMATQFSVTVFLLLWGFPFLTVGQGLSPAQASALFSVTVVSSMAAGPVIGVLTGRHPLRRSWMVLTIAAATAMAWAAVLLHPGRSPLWLLFVLALVLGLGGPGSVIGFDFARTSNATGRLGTATGLVNVAGFAAAVLAILAIGVVLDLRTVPGEPLGLPAFKVALSVMAVPWVVAVVGVLVSRRRTRSLMSERGLVVPPVREVLARRRDARAVDALPLVEDVEGPAVPADAEPGAPDGHPDPTIDPRAGL
ncbi:MAG: MFS transporter [Cellulomonadaceae bacterium]|nr:MFS transporter [Cellulomonadaceae bacterium]